VTAGWLALNGELLVKPGYRRFGIESSAGINLGREQAQAR
jgi:hypothetical protein